MQCNEENEQTQFVKRVLQRKVTRNKNRAYGVNSTLLPMILECGNVDVPQWSPVPVQYPGTKKVAGRSTGGIRGWDEAI